MLRFLFSQHVSRHQQLVSFLQLSGSETAVQDVRIVGQNGLLATYGTSAKLGSKTNNSGKIEDSLEDENKLIRYDDVKSTQSNSFSSFTFSKKLVVLRKI